MLQTTLGFLLILTCTTIFNIYPTQAKELKTYIVHLHSPEGKVFSEPHKLEEWYNSYLSKVATGSNEKPKLVYAYRRAITGFAAKMSAEQAKEMENLGGVLYVRPESSYELHTTRSPHFLGLRQNTGCWKDSNYGRGIIIGLLDTGITPGHPSFHDKGMPPPPARWKGKCEVARCNNKLIGLRSFVSYESVIDDVGHGTHTSGTAAGNFVDNVSIFGQGNGTASGMAPLAHLAMYKVCGGSSCLLTDILAGMDAAIEEGVDVLSISLGGSPQKFYVDTLAIAAYTATKSGIFVSCSAGNSGPSSGSVANDAPWMLTVGAGTTDRSIRTSVYLGNNKIHNGEALYQPENYKPKVRPLVYPAEKGYFCTSGSLNNIDVKGKVVLCDADRIIMKTEMGRAVKEAGGEAMILANNDTLTGRSVAAEYQVLPSSRVGYKEGVAIKKYLKSTSSPVATIIQHGTVLGVNSAPEVICFSSRGPSTITPGIMKPDIVGPGVDILAAWKESVDNKTRSKPVNMILGTSMSCPHLAGIAALVKSTHPEWSPAAIKSAMMTTASHVSLNGHAIVNERDLPADVFDMGSGHVKATKAIDPGLIYDIQPDDYIPYLCGLGYTPKQVQMIVKKKVSCSKTITEAQLNYPSFVVELKRGESKTYTRTVTNVGKKDSQYEIGDIALPKGVTIDVNPDYQQLTLDQKASYKVTFTRSKKGNVDGGYGGGYMTWVSVSGKYSVRTPFAIIFK